MGRSLFLLGFLAAVGYWYGGIDAATALRWSVFAVGVPLIFVMKPNLWNEAPPLALELIVICLILLLGTSFWSRDILTSADAAIHFTIMAGAYALGAAVIELRPLWIGMAYGVAVSAAIAVAQALGGLTFFEQTVSPAGLFVNKNFLADAGAVATIICIAYRRWVLLGFALAALLLPASYAAIGGVLGAVAMYIRERRPKTYHVLLAALVTGLGFGLFSRLSGDVRLMQYAAALPQLTWFGNGLGGYLLDFPNIEHVHFDALELIYDAGIFALPAIALFAYAALWGKNEPERSILIAILAIGILSFPLFNPLTACAAAVAAGHLVAGRVRVCSRNPWAADDDFIGDGKQEQHRNDRQSNGNGHRGLSIQLEGARRQARDVFSHR